MCLMGHVALHFPNQFFDLDRKRLLHLSIQEDLMPQIPQFQWSDPQHKVLLCHVEPGDASVDGKIKWVHPTSWDISNREFLAAARSWALSRHSEHLLQDELDLEQQLAEVDQQLEETDQQLEEIDQALEESLDNEYLERINEALEESLDSEYLERALDDALEEPLDLEDHDQQSQNLEDHDDQALEDHDQQNQNLEDRDQQDQALESDFEEQAFETDDSNSP